MSPWPIEEVWLRPVVTLALSALLPFATAQPLGRMLGGAALRAASAIVGPTELVLAALAGVTALGPALVERALGFESAAFAIACALVALASGQLARRKAARPTVERSRGLGIAVGVVTAATLVALVLAPWTLTAIADAPNANEDAARWRLRVDPWDPAAMLAAGWAERRREAYSRALLWAEEARTHGASEASTLELEAEVFATRGQCEEARARFDEALRARAEEAFTDPLAQPLELGGYRLPPSLLVECEGVSDP